MINEEFFRMASDEAKRGFETGDGLPFGAVIVKDDRFLVSAHNEVQKRNDPNAHSELLVVRKARRLLGANLRGCVLYTTCRPCQMCLQACLISEIDLIVYENIDIDSSSSTSSTKKYKKLRNLSNSAPRDETDGQKATWKKSTLKQVESDEKSMLIIASRCNRRKHSSGSTGSMSSVSDCTGSMGSSRGSF